MFASSFNMYIGVQEALALSRFSMTAIQPVPVNASSTINDHSTPTSSSGANTLNESMVGITGPQHNQSKYFSVLGNVRLMEILYLHMVQYIT